jgi:hypothetical protein
VILARVNNIPSRRKLRFTIILNIAVMGFQNKIYMGIAYICFHLTGVYGQVSKPDSVIHTAGLRRNEIKLGLNPVTTISGEEHDFQLAISLGYTRNLGNHHFIRTGVVVLPAIRSNLSTLGFGTEKIYFNGNDTIHFDSVFVSKGSAVETRASVYMGYEHLFGNGKLKFLLGLDALVGFSSYVSAVKTHAYQVTYVADSTNGQYTMSAQYLNTQENGLNLLVFHTGFSPRLGVRMDVTDRFAFSLVYAPIFYIDMKYHKFIYQADFPYFSLYGIPFSAEMGCSIKL